MAVESKIEWTDATFNPWIGCTKISPACDHCYASVATPTRSLGVEWGAGKPRRRTSPGNWKMPLRWNVQHADFQKQHGRRRRVFCASLADVFDNEVAIDWVIDLFDLIRQTPNLDWLLLTKRIGRVPGVIDHARRIVNVEQRGAELFAWLDEWSKGRPPDNVWMGATICNQSEANRDIPKLLRVPAVVRFLSMEPLLGPVNLTRVMREEGDWAFCDNVLSGFRAHKQGGSTDRRYAVDWVIVGGESGHGARPTHPDWVRQLRDHCAMNHVPFLFKQWGEFMPYNTFDFAPDDPRPEKAIVFHPPGSAAAEMIPVGKKHAGRELDGRHHDGVPYRGMASDGGIMDGTNRTSGGWIGQP